MTWFYRVGAAEFKTTTKCSQITRKNKAIVETYCYVNTFEG